MKIQKKGLAVAMGVVLASIACGGASQSQPPATTAAPATTATVPAATSALGTTAAGEFGVPECDRYMAKYKACLDSKVPENVKPMLKQTLDTTAAGWRQAAATPQGKSALASGCVQAEAMAKQSLAPYGCTW